MDLTHVINNIACGDIAQSNIHGHGLFANRDITEGEILGVLDGQVMNWDVYDALVSHLEASTSRAPELFLEWNCIAKDTLLVRPFRTKYSFVNHSRTPNCAVKWWPMRVVALADIKAGEEFTLDYRCEPLRDEYLYGHGATYL